MVTQSNPLVSVLMTAYNREKYIQAAIESVLASTWQQFELIIVDDRSVDETVSIARRYEQQDLRVKVYVNDTNIGDYPNRNKAASYALGKYLKYVDADDYIYPWGLQLLVEMMERNPEAGWGLCSLIQIVEKPYPFVLQPKEAYEQHYFGTGLFHKAPLSSIIRKDVFEIAGGFVPQRMTGDFEMWHRLGLTNPVLLMPDGIVWYREHSEQEVKSRQLFLKQYELIMLKYLNHHQCPLTAKQINTIKARRNKQLVRFMMADLMRFRFSGFYDNLKTWLFTKKQSALS